MASVSIAGLTLDIAGSLSEVEALWRTFEETAACTAFQAFDWHDAWQKNVGVLTGARVVIVTAREAGRLVAIFPFQVEPSRTVTMLRWHASDLCDYNVPLLAPGFDQLAAYHQFSEVFSAMLALVRAAPGLAFDAVELTKMPEQVGDMPNPFMQLPTLLNPNGAYATPLFGPWDDFYTAKRSSSTRRRDRTKRKRLGDMGPLEFVTSEGPDSVRAALSILMEQKGQAFAHMGVPNIFERPGYRDFYMDIATRPGARFAHVSQLRVGDEAAALNLGLIFRGSYYHVLASYSGGEVSRHGPGAAHLHDIMQYAISSGCTAFDFTIGDERYKREWTDGVIALHDLRRAVSLRGHIALMPSAVVARAKRIIKQNPALWNFAQKVRSRIGALRGGGAAQPVDAGEKEKPE